MRLNADLDVALTVLANGCYRWLATQLHGFAKAAPKQLYRKFVETGDVVEIDSDGVVIRFDKRCHNPVMIAGGASTRTMISTALPIIGLSSGRYSMSDSSLRRMRMASLARTSFVLTF